MTDNSAGGSYDVVILGGGSGGYSCALRATQLGLRVVMIEKGKLGGTCLHNGCIPAKALLHSAEVADQTRQSERFGVKTGFQGVDIAGVNSYKDKVIASLYNGLQGMLKSRKDLTLVQGEGRLVSPTAVEVDGVRYEGRHVVLATGSLPKSLPGLTIDRDRIISSDQALFLDRLPQSAVVLGGGVIGVEIASAWKSFGVDVTIVEALAHLVPAEDEEISKGLERAFRRRKIKFELGSRFTKAEYTDAGVRVTLENGKQLDAETLLVAVGRGPVSSGLGYEEAGVAMDRGHVLVDEHLRTNVPTISAVGDLIPTLQLAHVGFAEGILVAERLAGERVTPIDYDGVARVTYCEPEIASVGLTEAKAREQYGSDKVVVSKFNLGSTGKNKILKATGEIKLVQVHGGPVVGLHMIGPRMSEQIGEAQLIYNWEALPAEVAQLIHAHPTQNEALGEAHLALAGKPLHVHD
ncbi:dihydrolipoyl dehydrogenase [Streptomyces sp. NBC_01618]|uniref:dihydrolipoyl dehydrogenase n=1 Tax=Streptomyces sp. NBC_01618 TaxID=2975900 RepID=UPI00386E18B7|nr:dihydrolipoyl dehydrogenase [Streptomyces sp. NBC_01618]